MWKIWLLLPVLLLPISAHGQTIQSNGDNLQITTGNQVRFTPVDQALEDGIWKPIEDCRSLLGTSILRIADDGINKIGVQKFYWSKLTKDFVVRVLLTAPVGDVPYKKLQPITKEFADKIKSEKLKPELEKDKTLSNLVLDGNNIVKESVAVLVLKDKSGDITFHLTQGQEAHFGNKSTVVTITTEGTSTWTCPAGITSVQTETWGAGGGGGGGSSLEAGCGGGGGGYSKVNAFASTPGTGYQVIVGAKGTGAIGNNAGVAGADSTFNVTTCVGKGGSGGTGGSGGAVGAGGVAGTGDVKYTGGNGGLRGGGGGGGGGSSAGTAANGNNGADGPNAAGGAAPTGGYAGGAGAPGINTFASANSATNYGGAGGGGGAASMQSGGNGTGGRVVLTYSAGSTTSKYFIRKKKGMFFIR